MLIVTKKKAPPKVSRIIMNLGEDEYLDAVEEAEENGEYAPEGTGHAEESPYSDGVAPVFTGLLNQYGDPVLRHPMRIRVGFHPEANKYHAPTVDDDSDGSGSVVGWAYEY